MPPKIRELISELQKAGFTDRGGKGSHRNFVHPRAIKPITISGSPGDPNSTITLYPVPTVANTLKIRVWTPFTALALSDTYALPPGYEEAIVYNLCMRLYPEYPAIAVNPAVAEIARTALASVKRLNSKPFISITQLSKLFGYGGTKVDITAGE